MFAVLMVTVSLAGAQPAGKVYRLGHLGRQSG
jgi:hypothetical protein